MHTTTQPIDLVLIAGPAAEPITLADAKDHLRVCDDSEDDLVTAYIVAAREYVETVTGRKLITQTWEQRLECFPHHPQAIAFDLFPVRTIVSVKYTDADGAEQTMDSADYLLRIGRLPQVVEPVYNSNWPSVARDVVIRVTVGDAAAPAAAVHAIRLLVGHWYENREAVVIGQTPSSVPMAAKALLQSIRARGL